MTTHVIHVIREMTDRGGPARKSLTYYCSDVKNPVYACWEPNADIFETEEEVHIALELAGVNRDEVCVQLKAGKLIISGVRREKRPEGKVNYHQLELNYGHFMKIISLPEAVEHNDIFASLRDGLLEIKISKKVNVIEIPVTRGANNR